MKKISLDSKKYKQSFSASKQSLKFSISPSNYKAFLFDWDGTLVDTEIHQHAAHTKFFSEMGITYFSLEEHILKYGGRGFKIIYEELLGPMEEEEFEEIKTKRRKYFVELIGKNGVDSVKGVINFLQEAIRARLKLGIVTGSSKKTHDQTVHVSDIPIQLFETIIYQDDYKVGKPHPEPYLLAAKRLGIKPEECLVFENAPNGVLSAINAGMDYFALTTNLSEKHFKKINPKAKIIKDFTQIHFLDDVAKSVKAK